MANPEVKETNPRGNGRGTIIIPRRISDHPKASQAMFVQIIGNIKAKLIFEMAQSILPELLRRIEPEFEAKIVRTKSQIGSGALPLDQLDSFALCIESADKSDKALREIARRFRTLQVPIIGRITGGRLLFDLRTLELPSSFLDPIAELKTV